jgi:hypothetical protein
MTTKQRIPSPESLKCNHELVARVSPAGDDFTCCTKCGGHWCGPAMPDYAGEFEARGYRQEIEVIQLADAR